MTSEKSYSTEQRLNALIAQVGGDSSWTDTAGLQNGWGKGSGYFKYKLILPGVVLVAAKDLTAGTTSPDGTTILSAANGLISGYRPAANHIIPCYTDQERIVVGSNVSAAGLKFVTDGSVQELGIGSAATTVSCYGLLFIDI